MSKLQTVAVVIIAFTVTLAVFYYAGLFDEFLVPSQNMPEDTAPNSTPLTPARNLEGTWKTAFPVRFYIKTDFETFGELKDVGSENRTMTWIITGTSDEKIVNVEVRFAVSNRQLAADSGYTPDVSPNFYTGTISGTRLTLTEGGGQFSESRTVGEFSFTTDVMTGTWSDRWSMAYEQEVYTQTNKLVLARQ